MAYNAVINFSGEHREINGEMYSNAFTIKINLNAEAYDESGQPSEGTITFNLLNEKGENITSFVSSNASNTPDGGVIFILGGGGAH